MSHKRDARSILLELVGRTTKTLTGRPNVVLGIEGDNVRVGTRRSPHGQLVPLRAVQDALDQLEANGVVEVSVESVGYRSAFIGAVLATLPDVEVSPATMTVRCTR